MKHGRQTTPGTSLLFSTRLLALSPEVLWMIQDYLPLVDLRSLFLLFCDELDAMDGVETVSDANRPHIELMEAYLKQRHHCFCGQVRLAMLHAMPSV